MITTLLWGLTILFVVRNVIGFLFYINHPLSGTSYLKYKYDLLDVIGLLSTIGLFVRYW